MTEPKHPDPEESPATSQESGAESPSVSQDAWASALAEQTAHDQPTQAAGLSHDDDWASALVEPTAAQGTGTQTGTRPAAAQVLEPLSAPGGNGAGAINILLHFPVTLYAPLGTPRLTINNKHH